MTTTRALMTAVLAVAVLIGGAIALETAAPHDFPIVFRILMLDGAVGLLALLLILRVMPRDSP